MKRLIALFLLVPWCLSANAYTIDFEEFVVGSVGPLTSGDFIIYGSSDQCHFESCGAVTDEQAFTVGTVAAPTVGGQAGIVIEHVDGSAFALYSLDILAGDELVGTTVDGSIATGPVGQGDWLNVTSLSVSSYVPDGYTVVKVDNIIVSAVPVPATAWLFVSALTGLAWSKRRNTT